VGRHARSLPQAKEKASNDRGSSNHIAEDLEQASSEAKAVCSDSIATNKLAPNISSGYRKYNDETLLAVAFYWDTL